MDICALCQWPKFGNDPKPIQIAMLPPAWMEASMERMMDMQGDLFDLGILPPKDDGEEDDSDTGPYQSGIPVEDDYEERKPAFYSGLYAIRPYY